MTFTTPPTFHRPEGNPVALRELATLLTSVAEVLEQIGSTADEMSDRNSQLYWEGRPGDVFWDGTAQINYIEAAVRRRRLVETAGTTFREAGTVLGASADNLVKAQMAVDEAQSVANQRATAGAASPVPTSFDQEQMVASTAGSLAVMSGGEAASRLRALADSIPGYVAPAVAGATTTGSELGARGASAPIGTSVGGSATGGGAAAGPAGGSVGSVSGGGSASVGVGDDGVSTWSSDGTPSPGGTPGSAGSAGSGAAEETTPGAGSTMSGSAATLDDGTPSAVAGGPDAGPASSQSAATLDDGAAASAAGGTGAAGGGAAAAGSAAGAAGSDDEDERRVPVEEQG